MTVHHPKQRSTDQQQRKYYSCGNAPEKHITTTTAGVCGSSSLRNPQDKNPMQLHDDLRSGDFELLKRAVVGTRRFVRPSEQSDNENYCAEYELHDDPQIEAHLSRVTADFFSQVSTSTNAMRCPQQHQHQHDDKKAKRCVTADKIIDIEKDLEGIDLDALLNAMDATEEHRTEIEDPVALSALFASVARAALPASYEPSSEDSCAASVSTPPPSSSATASSSSTSETQQIMKREPPTRTCDLRSHHCPPEPTVTQRSLAEAPKRPGRWTVMEYDSDDDVVKP
jgi:cell division septation protein DedD